MDTCINHYFLMKSQGNYMPHKKWQHAKAKSSLVITTVCAMVLATPWHTQDNRNDFY